MLPYDVRVQSVQSAEVGPSHVVQAGSQSSQVASAAPPVVLYVRVGQTV